jgi:hypothetical protein
MDPVKVGYNQVSAIVEEATRTPVSEKKKRRQMPKDSEHIPPLSSS